MTADLLRTRYLVLTGNYGSGKTEIALNLSLIAARCYQTTLVDLDIVNPYFRSGEKAEELQRAGICVLMPTYAMTTVDIPALPAEIQSVFDSGSEKVIFDVGGDDTGAAALGRYYPSFQSRREDTTVALVINCMRPLTRTPAEIVDLAERIQNRSRLRIDVLINNTNLARKTTPEMLLEGEAIVTECARRMGVSKVVSAYSRDMQGSFRLLHDSLCIKRYMIPEWREEQ